MARAADGDVLEGVIEVAAPAARRDTARREEARPAPPGEDGGRPEGAAPRPRRPRQEPAQRQPGQRQELIAALSSRSALRRAFLLQEVLGPPKALRGPDAGLP